MAAAPRIIHVLFVNDEHGCYAQCLEFNIGAQGDTIEEAQRAFLRTWHLQIAMDRAHGRKPFEGLDKAHDRYWRMLDDAIDWHGQVAPDDEPDVPPAYMIAAHVARARSSIPTQRAH